MSQGEKPRRRSVRIAAGAVSTRGRSPASAGTPPPAPTKGDPEAVVPNAAIPEAEAGQAPDAGPEPVAPATSDTEGHPEAAVPDAAIPEAEAGQAPDTGPDPVAPAIPDPDAPEAPRFLASLYEAMNPDIALAAARGQIDPASHWQGSGRAEEHVGQRPSLNHQHYLAPTRAALREPGGVVAETLAGFDPAGYGFLNADLLPLIGQDREGGTRHFVQSGIIEERFAPGWRPNAGRDTSVAGLLARPVGVDLYAPFAYFGPLGRLARGLAFALEASGLPYTLQAFDPGVRPRIPLHRRGRPGTHRVSLILCEPQQTQALVDNYPADHFADSYVIALWPGEWRRGLRQPIPVEGALDEVWVGGAAQQAALSGVLRAPLYAVTLPIGRTGDAAARLAVRAELGLSPTTRCALFSLDDLLPPWSDRPMTDMARSQLGRVLDAFRTLDGPADALLLIQAPREPIVAEVAAQLEAIGDERIVVLAAPGMLGADRQLQDAADLLICGDGGWAAELRAGAFLAAGRPVLAVAGTLGLPGVVTVTAEALAVEFNGPGPRHSSLPVFARDALSGALAVALFAASSDAPAGLPPLDPRAEEERFGQALLARIAALGLDTPPLAFTRHLGASSGLGPPRIFGALPPRSHDRLERLRGRPFFDVLILAGGSEDARAGRIEISLAALAAQAYPLLRIHVVTATDGLDPVPTPLRRPGVLLPPAGSDFASALAAAVSACTGSHVVLLEAGAAPKPWALTEFAIGADGHTRAAFFAESEGAGGPVSQRASAPIGLTTAFDPGPMLCLPHAVFAALPPPPGGGHDVIFAVAAALIARAQPLEVLDEVLSTASASASLADASARAGVIASLAAEAGGRLLTDRYGSVRLAPALEALPAVTLVVTASDQAALPAALAALRRLSATRYPALRFALVADQMLEGRIDTGAAGVEALSVHYADAGLGGAALRQRGLINATTPLVVLVDADRWTEGADVTGEGSPGQDWLAELAETALMPGFGAAGPAVAAGGPTPSRLGEVMAVDGGCLLLDRIAALAAGGFGAAYTRIRTADIALCLALRTQGARVMVVPGAGRVGPAGDVAPVLAELEAEWGAFTPEDFARRQRPLRRRVAQPGAAATTRPRLRQAPPAVSEADVPPVPSAAPARAGGWRRSV